MEYANALFRVIIVVIVIVIVVVIIVVVIVIVVAVVRRRVGHRFQAERTVAVDVLTVETGEVLRLA